MVEPLAGVFGAFAVVLAEPLLPYALAFAAGAMVYVVMDDIIPEAQIRLESDPSLICPWTLSQSQGLSLQIFPFFIFAPTPSNPLPRSSPPPSQLCCLKRKRAEQGAGGWGDGPATLGRSIHTPLTQMISFVSCPFLSHPSLSGFFWGRNEGRGEL